LGKMGKKVSIARKEASTKGQQKTTGGSLHRIRSKVKNSDTECTREKLSGGGASDSSFKNKPFFECRRIADPRKKKPHRGGLELVAYTQIIEAWIEQNF